jgi:hypothetical protein
LVTISGLIYNAMELKTTKDTFLFPIIFYFTDFLIILFTGYLIDLPILGRRIPAVTFSLLGGIFYTIKFFFLKHLGEATSFFWLDYAIRLCVSISFNILIEYNLEIYSTDIRATAFNINKLFSRVGDFTLPLILATDRQVATALMSVMYLFMTLFVMKLRETQGEKLRETVDDSDRLELEEEMKQFLKEEEERKEETKDEIKNQETTIDEKKHI